MLRRVPKFGASQATAAGVAVTGPAVVPSPALFTARTSKAYAVALVRPLTRTLVSSPALLPVSLLSATAVQSVASSTVIPAAWRYSYRVIAAPPLVAGADQFSRTSPPPAVAARFCGALGTVTVRVVPLTRIMRAWVCAVKAPVDEPVRYKMPFATLQPVEPPLSSLSE